MQARLSQDKLSRLCQELATWQAKKSCTHKELEHLVGTLQFACKVVPQGRPFVRRMINLLCVPTKPFHHVRLNKEFRSDLLWWHSFVHIWNGISFLRLTNGLIPLANIFTDASGSFGCGAVWGLVDSRGLASGVAPSQYNDQRNGSCGSGLCYLGPSVVWQTYSSPHRQLGSSESVEKRFFQRTIWHSDAPSTLFIFYISHFSVHLCIPYPWCL